MTHDEVDKIYDYLHANYEYRDGELVKNKGHKKGVPIGSFYSYKDKTYIRGVIMIDGKRIAKPLTHLVFLYHNHYFPKFIDFIDNNPTNCKIENLIEITPTYHCYKNKNNLGYETIVNKNSIKYKVVITKTVGKKKIKMNFGYYPSIEIAKKVYEHARKMYESGSSEEEIQESIKINFSPLKRQKYRKGLTGAHFQRGKFHASININKKKIYLGSFAYEKEAHEAYLKAKAELS